MSLFDRPIAADHTSHPEQPCLILGTIPGERPGDHPFFLVVWPDGALGTTELPYLRTKWRWNAEKESWDDLMPFLEAGELIAGEIGEAEEET
jgi:hypothetical protein